MENNTPNQAPTDEQAVVQAESGAQTASDAQSAEDFSASSDTPPAAEAPAAQSAASAAVTKPTLYIPEKYEIERRDIVLSASLLVAAFLLVAAGFWSGLRVGYAFSFDLLLILIGVYLKKPGQNFGVFSAVCGVLAIALSPVFVLTSNGLVRVLSAAAAGALAVAAFAGEAGRPVPAGEMGPLMHILLPVGDAITNMSRSIRSLGSMSGKRSKNLSGALIGLVCAVPVLLVVVPLLISSDAAFEGMVSRFAADLGTRILQLGITLMITPFLIGLAFSLRKPDPPVESKLGFNGVDTVALSSFMAVLSLCYLCYMFSQLAYFFSAFSGFLPEKYSFSYAEYARRGFFELCVIAGINLAILFIMIILSKKKDNTPPAAIKGLGTFIGVFTLLLIATAISKMVMYIDNYGMTVLRLGTSVFMIFTAVVFIAMLLRLFIGKIRVLYTAIITAACLLVALGVCNINAVCARYNYEAFMDGRLDEIDVDYLYDLGDEGVPYLVKLAASDDGVISDDTFSGRAYTLVTIHCMQHYYTEEYFNSFHEALNSGFSGQKLKAPTASDRRYSKITEFNLPLSRAYGELEGYIERCITQQSADR